MKRIVAAAVLLAAPPALAALPQPVPQPPDIPAPLDTSYPGTIALTVDATDLDRHIMSVAETIPVSTAGDMVLLYPQWIPGHHSPAGPLADLAGMEITAAGKPVAWTRDVVQQFAFHVAVPPGATMLDVRFQYLSAPNVTVGRVEMTPDLIDLQWNAVVLYPAGHFSRGITVSPKAKIPAGFHFASALTPVAADSGDGGTIVFHDTTLNTLVDSPVLAGRYFNRVDLDPGGKVPVHLDVFADRASDLTMSADQLGKHRALVQQAYRTFQSHHYDHYDFLLSLSDEMGGIGLEHHRSSEDGVGANYFTNWDTTVARRDLLAHEYTHSWNGKFRRPADLWAPNFNVPERDSLLWMYEGQTQYWGQILAARSGLFSRQEALDSLAGIAAMLQSRAGRAWRNLQDTTNAPIIDQRRPLGWVNWQRPEDYYPEGLLIWLDADTLIRQQTGGAKSLNDFARTFFGMHDGSFVTKIYDFDDVVHALNGIMPHDWAGFLRSRLDGHGPGAPLDGITRGGYRLVFTDTQSAFSKSAAALGKVTDFSYSVGLALHDTTVASVLWDSPAFKAGIIAGDKIIAVNGLAIDDAGGLKDAITSARTDAAPIELLLQAGRHFRTAKVDYHGGLRYPHLQRIDGTPPLLDNVLAALP